MKPNFISDLREAVRLTRTGKLAEATRLIQKTLSEGSPDPVRNHPFGPSRSPVHPQACEAELSPLPPSASKIGVEAPLERPSFGNSTRGRLRRPPVEIADLPKVAHRHAPVPVGAEFLMRSFTGRSGTRAYKLYVPRQRRALNGLIVMLHGCTQDADDFAAGTGMNQAAEDRSLLVAYPIQSRGANPSRCWNWFDLKNQKHEAGEPAIIAGLTRELIEEFRVDPRRVFIAGLSAGGAMAAIMGATYSDIYAAVGVHSGLQYGAAGDLISALAAMRGDGGLKGRRQAPGPASAVRTIVFHGDADSTVHPANGDAIAAAAKSHPGWSQEETAPGRSPGGIDYLRSVARNGAGQPIVEHWTLQGMGHVWSGGNPAGSYTDARGPDASREMVRFFLEE